jgi:hypothetical protein
LSEKTFTTAKLNELDMSAGNELQIYSAAKAIAEREVWEIAHRHPDVDITVRKSIFLSLRHLLTPAL